MKWALYKTESCGKSGHVPFGWISRNGNIKHHLNVNDAFISLEFNYSLYKSLYCNCQCEVREVEE